jgi:predicted methyltransferase
MRTTRTKVKAALLVVLLLASAGCVKRQTHIHSPTTIDPALLDTARAIVGSPDRSADDRALDAGRHPDRLLVAEIGAGLGYTTELLARAVAPNGVVYAQNNQFIREKFAEKPWTERLAKPVMKPVVRVDREFDDPLPPAATKLDAVVNVMLYHDTVWMKTDRAKMNRAIYAALRPGGVYVIVDHSAKAGTGLNDVQTLHRIEESTLRHEVEAAGFKLVADADFLRNPADTRDWSASPRTAGERRGTSDRFVLKFAKPS